MLDLGGGTGRISFELARAIGGRFTVADVDARALSRVPSGAGLEAILTEARADLPFEAGSFDAVLMVDVLHHIADGDHFLKESVRCLKPAGKLVVVDFDGAHRMTGVFGTLARLAGRRCRFRRPDDLARDLGSLGLRARAGPVDSLRYLVEADR